MRVKRVVDVVCALCGIIVLSPLLLVVGALLVIIDGRPVLFKQTRVGLEGRNFQILKFRTMRVNNDSTKFSRADDARITRLGSLLRKSKLDELPQLMNVLRGDMSVVGPRPEVPEYVAFWPQRARTKVLSVRPGITDPASLKYRNEGEILAAVDNPSGYYAEVITPDKLRMYERYVDNRSAMGDLKIVLQTVAPSSVMKS